jgi:predicted 3-demethylubiquinone-9 3-methyltransferase (glyoxalase superfamily)
MNISSKIAPCLWFDTQAEVAARYGKAGFDQHQKKEGTVMTVQFELAGQTFTALNGGPNFKFNEAVSLQIYVDDQKDLDYFWDKLTAGGDPDEKSERAMAAMMSMKELDIATLDLAYHGR